MRTENLENPTIDQESQAPEENGDNETGAQTIFAKAGNEETGGKPTNIFNEGESEKGESNDEGPIEIKLGDTALQLDVKGIDKDSAQKVADQLASKITEAAKAATKANDAALQKDLYEQSLSDKDIGGERFKETSRLALKAVKALGTPELKQLLTGPVGSHPEVLRFLSRVGAAISEDSFVAGRPPNESKEAQVSKALDELFIVKKG